MRWVIPDVHGCAKTLRALLDKIGPNKSDVLFFLGDLIDKGPDSGGVLDLLMNLQAEHFQIQVLRGNHEENLLYAHEHYNPRALAGFVGRINKSSSLLDGQQIKPHYLTWIYELPYFLELDDYWLVHASFNTQIDDIFSDVIAMIEGRMPVYDEAKLKNKPIIRGHQVTPIHEVMNTIARQEMIISLDNGCVYAKGHRRHDASTVGNLLAFNLDTLTLLIQKNVEENLPI